MTMRQFAFVRAINTGQRRLTNDQLIAPFVELGLGEVAAYQAAGNVSFRSDDDPEALAVRLEDALTEAYGFAAPTFVRTHDELRAVVDGQPFSDTELAATEGRVQVALLRAPPDAEAITTVASLVPSPDRIAFVGAHWFWLPRAGISTSATPVRAIERVVGPMTIRTLGTLERMLRKFDA